MKLDATKLRTVSFEKGLTQKNISEQTGISTTTMSGIFRGLPCRRETAEKISQALDVTVEELMEGSENAALATAD